MKGRNVTLRAIFMIGIICFQSLGLALSISITKTENDNIEIVTNSELPKYFSWRDRNGIDFTTPIRMQQPYGSCETFAFVAAVETMVQAKVGYPFGCDLSEAHLYFWSRGDLYWGSYPENDTNFLVEYGVPDEACWPYPNHLEHPYVFPKNTTQPNWQERTVKIKNWSYLQNSVEAIKNAIVNNGPVPTYLDVYEDFQRYKGGVYEHKWGKSVGIHLVCIMGYQDDESISSGGYWIVKNSWGVKLRTGTPWGEEGWFRIAYGEASIEQQAFHFGEVYGQFPILYVDDDNTAGPWDGSEDYPYQTIMDAIDVAYEGWTVHVKNGVYNENIVINKTINLDGESKENTIINGNYGEIVIYVQAPDVRIYNLTIQNSGKQRFNSGIRTLSLNSNVTIKNCIIQNNDVGIYLNYMFEESGNLVEDNIIRNNRDGIFVNWALNNHINNNEIYNNNDYGIEFLSGKESYIENNVVYGNGRVGIYLQGGADRNSLVGNNILNNPVGLEIDQSNNNDIIKNNFIDNNLQASYSRSHDNKWRRNYWSDWERIIPRPIKGSLNFRSITWFNFDWLPKRQQN